MAQTLITQRQLNFIESIKETREWESDPELAGRIRDLDPETTTFQMGGRIIWGMGQRPLRKPQN